MLKKSPIVHRLTVYDAEEVLGLINTAQACGVFLTIGQQIIAAELRETLERLRERNAIKPR